MTATADIKPESRAFEADVSRLLHLMVHSVYSDKDVFLRELISNAADACERLRYEAIADAGTARRRRQSAHHHQARRRRQEPHRRGQRHRHEPRRDGRGARHHRALRHQGLHGAARGQQGRRKRDPDRPVRRRLLLGVHGRRQGRRDLAPRRQRRSMALVLRRQGHLHGRARRAGRRAGARHARHPASDGRRQGLHRALQHRAHRQGELRPRAGADLDRREARRRGRRTGRRRGALDQAALGDQARGIHRLLSQLRRLRRAGADRAFPRRRPPRVHRARLRAERAAVRPLRPRAQEPDEALRQARLHHRRRGNPAALSALRARAGRFRRPAAQPVARDDPEKPGPRRHQEERHRARAGRPGKARRQRRRGLRQDLGRVRRGASRRASTRITSGATRCSSSRASAAPLRRRCGEASRTMSRR